MAIPAWWKALQTVFQLAGRAAGILRRIPLVDDAADRLARRLLNPVIVKLVRNADDPDLDAALELYRKRIPDDQRFESSDIVRWIRDDRLSRRANPDAPTDWFVVAKLRRRVCGFILFHYYPSTQLALFAYMVVANTPGVPVNAVSSALSSEASRLFQRRKELRSNKGFVLEVDDPRRDTNARKRDESLARIRRFCTLSEMQGFSLRALDIAYMQPKLSLDDLISEEKPLLLLSARSRSGPLAASVDRSEVEEVLSFIYTKVYPEGYSTDSRENQAYLAYCSALRDREVAMLPNQVRSLSSAQLVAQVRGRAQN